LVGDRERGVLIGATLVSPRAGEILGELLLAIKLRTPLKTLADVGARREGGEEARRTQ
jgi:pyruvate/2-oxoglutarate dehydrogenase complex dihydrolipoamide dehydrogenase (E3) component